MYQKTVSKCTLKNFRCIFYRSSYREGAENIEINDLQSARTAILFNFAQQKKYNIKTVHIAI